MEKLLEELKKEIIETLELDDVTPEEINPDDPLVGDGLGLDSIDTLELVVLMERKYGVKVDNIKEGREIFGSLRKMAEFIETNR
jgi:acyl carrier protein